MFSHYHGKHAKSSRFPTAAALAGTAAVLALVLTGSICLTAAGPSTPGERESSLSQVHTDAGRPGGAQPEVTDQARRTEQPQPPPQPEQPGKAAPEAEPPQPEPYDFSQPAPASEAVDNRYFDDAAFVGDSRTDGFLLYSGIGTGKNLTSNGLSIFKLATRKALTIGGKEYTLLEALALEPYGKVYLSLGVNELGYRDDQGFYDHYCKAIDSIRAAQPNAVIYIQGLIPLNEAQISSATGRTYLTNEHLRVYNSLMRQVAEEKQVVFLDLYTEFADENGSLPADASRDGVHLKRNPCKQWLAYLQTHTVGFDTLYPGGISSNTVNEGSDQT